MTCNKNKDVQPGYWFQQKTIL